jgi:hypothetical protein
MIPQRCLAELCERVSPMLALSLARARLCRVGALRVCCVLWCWVMMRSETRRGGKKSQASSGHLFFLDEQTSYFTFEIRVEWLFFFLSRRSALVPAKK